MGIRVLKIAPILIILCLSIVFFTSDSNFISFEQNFSASTQFENKLEEKSLYISIPSSLKVFYQNLDHRMWDNRSYSKFVTPELFTDVADKIKNTITDLENEDEQFVNLVLDFVHNIEYKKSGLKFPVETLSDGYGDCDSLSFLAASILKAGGLEVVLFFYDTNGSVNHMNFGVNLPNKKVEGINGTEAFFYRWQEENYFVCEATGDRWQVGNQPTNYLDSNPKVIPVDDFENLFFEPLSSSLNFPLNSSDLSMEVRPVFVGGKNVEEFEIFGSLNPNLGNQKVNVLIKRDSEFDTLVKSVLTDEFGNYKVFFDFDMQGKYTVQAIWMGVEGFFACESEKILVNVGANIFLQRYEFLDTVQVGSEILEIPSLLDSGKRIFRQQPIKTIFDQKGRIDSLNVQAQITFFGNDEPFLTRHNITVPAYEKHFMEDGQVITKIIPEDTIEIRNYRDKMHSKVLLSFVGKQNQLNFSVQLLDNSNLEELMKDSNEKIIDVSNLINENIGYVVDAAIVGNQFSLKIFDQDLIVFDDSTNVDLVNGWEFKAVFSYEPDSIPCLSINKEGNQKGNKYFFSNF